MRTVIGWTAILAGLVAASPAQGQTVTLDATGKTVRRPDGSIIRTRAGFSLELMEIINPAGGEAAPIPVPAIATRSFDGNVYRDEQTPSERRAHLSGKLARCLEYESQVHKLTATECKKLELAGRRDIHLFFMPVESARREFEAVRWDWEPALAVLDEMLPFGESYRRGLHREGSLFAKSLAKILADRESAWAKADRD